MPIFEILMLICFGLAWPFSIYKSYKTRHNGSKSLMFLLVIFIGYLCGIAFKYFEDYDNIIYLYILNGFMVLADICLFIRNEYFTYKLTDAEEQLYLNHFSNMPRPIFCELIRSASYETIRPGNILIKEHTHPEKIYYLLDGVVQIMKDNIIINQLGAHSFAGEMSFLTKKPASADVVAKTKVACLAWDKKKLNTQTHLRDYYNIYLAMDLANKVKSTEEFKRIL